MSQLLRLQWYPVRASGALNAFLPNNSIEPTATSTLRVLASSAHVERQVAQVRHRISAGVLIEDSGRLLLVRHVKPGAYDFWVAPGGGVQGLESLREAAQREAREETGLEVQAGSLAYVEELASPEVRYCKFWFTGKVLAGKLSVEAREAQSEGIVEATWLSRHELQGVHVFPPVLLGRYWQDRESGFAAPVCLELRRMEFW